VPRPSHSSCFDRLNYICTALNIRALNVALHQKKKPFFLRNIQTGAAAHPPSYLRGTRAYFQG
jgi:hypothetical protein